MNIAIGLFMIMIAGFKLFERPFFLDYLDGVALIFFGLAAISLSGHKVTRQQMGTGQPARVLKKRQWGLFLMGLLILFTGIAVLAGGLIEISNSILAIVVGALGLIFLFMKRKKYDLDRTGTRLVEATEPGKMTNPPA